MARDWTNNYIGGSKTASIFYKIRSNSPGNLCNTEFYTLTLSGSPCNYVCLSNQALCEADSSNFDYECNQCNGCPSGYGCVRSSPLTCWTSTCPPWPFNNDNCESCYPHSKSISDKKCGCDNGYYQSQINPLICLRKD